MAKRAGRTQGKRPARAVAGQASGRPKVAVVPADVESRLTQIAFWALVAALVVSVVAIKQTGLIGSSYFLKDWVIRLLVAVSLALWGGALLKGQTALRWHRVVRFGVGYLVWAGLCVALSASPATGLIGTALGEAGWLSLASSALGGFLMLQLADRASRIRTLLRAVAVAGLVSASYGVIQTLGLDPVQYDPRPWGAFRAFGTFANPDMYGAFTVLALPLVICLALTEKDARWRWVAGLAFVAIGFTGFASLTRAAWLGAVVGLVTLALFFRRLKPTVGRFELRFVGALVAALLIFSVVSIQTEDLDSNILARATNTADAAQSSTTARFEMWRIAGAAIAERPILGWGPDTFLIAFETHRTEDFSALVDPGRSTGSAHNWVFQTAVETGVVGLLLLIGLYTGVAVVSARWIPSDAPAQQLKARIPFAGAWAACAGCLATTLLTPGSHPSRLLLWFLLAILLSPLTSRPEPARGVAQKATAWAVVGVGVLLAVVTIVAVYADDQANLAGDVGVQPALRAAAGEAAMAANPLSAEYAVTALNAHVNLVPATGLAAAGTRSPAFDDALAAADRAIALEPGNPYRTAGLVGLLVIGGEDVDPTYTQSAVETARTAVERWPNHLELSYWYAKALVDAGEMDKAVMQLRRVLDIRPGYGQAALLMSDLLAGGGDADGARAVLEASLKQAKNAQVKARLESLGGSTP